MGQNRPHVHGSARLLINTHNDNLEVVLESPAANIFGFEHLPENDNDHQTIHDRTEILENAANLFNTGDAGCTLESVAMDSGQILAHEQAKHAETEAENDFSEFEENDLPTETGTITQHNDVDTTWIFSCSHSEKLNSMIIKFFTAFPEGFKHLRVEWNTEKSIGTLELQQDDTLLFAP